MTTVSASELFRDVAVILGWDPDNLSEREWLDIRDAVSMALKQAWEFAWWPDLMRTYHTAFKPSWSQDFITAHGTYPVDTILYDPFTRGYYQALEATATRPTAWNGTTKAWEYTPGVWHPTPNTEDSTTWDPEATYAVGDVVTFDDDTYVAMGSVAAGEDHSPALDSSSWHRLLPFSLSYSHTGWVGREPVGLVKSITDNDPDEYRGPATLRFDTQHDRTVAYDPEGAKVWVRYRINCPKLTGDIWSASAAYTVAPVDQQIYGEVLTPSSFTVYWGASDLTTLNGSQIAALSDSGSVSNVETTYDFDANTEPGKYLYIAWPDFLGDQLATGTGFTALGFPVSMAATSEGYTSTENGWGYKVVAVDGVNYRLYRTYNLIALEYDITVTLA